MACILLFAIYLVIFYTVQSPILPYTLIALTNALIINILLYEKTTIKHLLFIFVADYTVQLILFLMLKDMYYIFILVAFAIQYLITFLGLVFTHNKKITFVHAICISLLCNFVCWQFSGGLMIVLSIMHYNLAGLVYPSLFFSFTISLQMALLYIQYQYEKQVKHK